jgi:release factor glutamine methyltransferase
MRIVALPGVFRPRSDCWLLASVIRDGVLARGASVLDLFTGTGALGVAAAKAGARAVTVSDLSFRAALNALVNARLNGVRLRARRGDMFAPIAEERFDLILANPPYVPGCNGGPPRRGRQRAWEGGPTGRLLLDRLCAEAGAHLTAGGSLLLVQSSLSGERETLDALAAGELTSEVLSRRRGPLGPIVAARAATLERRGLLAPGQREEELLVIRARSAH